MLSVLIPVFNYDINDLVEALLIQGKLLHSDFEIIIADDCSTDLELIHKNQELNQLENVKFIQADKNLGRAEIRNWLANIARFENLLFLDADVLPVNKGFLEKYLNELKNHDFIYGGLSYDYKPKNPKSIRYRYGVKYEAPNIQKRILYPNNYFTAANFLIKKETFKKSPFRVLPENYGYLDHDFLQQQINLEQILCQIDNPVFHLGLEADEAFLNKVEKGLLNAKKMMNLGYPVAEQIKIVRWYKKFKKYNLIGVFRLFNKLFGKRIKSALKTLPIQFLQLYKLLYFCSIND